MPVGDAVSSTTTTSGFGRASRSRSYPTQAARGPVSPSGSAKTRSVKCSAPARKAASVESAGRLPTSSRSLVTRRVICRRLPDLPRRWSLILLGLVIPSTADARVRVSAPRARASGVPLPLTITGAPPRTPVVVERRTSAGWIGVKAVDSNASGRASVRLHTPARTRRWRLRVRAADQRSAAIGVSIRPVTLTSVGDINLGDGPGDVMAARGDRYPWAGVASRLRGADIAFGNLECSVSNRGAPVVKQYTFRGKPSRLKTVRGYAGMDVVNLANNHVGDYGKQALADTVRYVRRAGLVGIGAGSDLEGARRPRVISRLGLKVVFVGFSDIGPYDFAAGPG